MSAFVAGLSGEQGRSLDEDAQNITEEGTGGQDEPVTWVQVATAMGRPNAVIIAGRLESCGVPTMVTQESAGVNVYPVTIGAFGTAHIWVPEEFERQAREILDQEWDEEE